MPILSQAKPARMLVTGATGLLGANFCLAAREEYLVNACALRYSLRTEGIADVRIDLRDGMQVGVALDALRPEIIVHFAAAPDVNRCEAKPEEAEMLNVAATGHLARWAARAGARFLLMSTDAVFEGSRGHYNEHDAPAPVNRYADTKLRSEQVVISEVQDHLVVRASIYGWNAQPKFSLAEWVLGRLESNERVPGFTDVVFAPLLANTLSDFMLTLLRQQRRGLYHAASRDALSKYEFALAIAEEFSLPVELVDMTSLAVTPLPARRPFNTSLDASKLAVDTGIELPTVRQDLRRLHALRDAGWSRQLKTICFSSSHD